MGAWILAALALVGTLFFIPVSCAIAQVQEGSNTPTEWCDGILGFRTPFLSSSELGILFTAIAVTGILLIEATRRTIRIRSRHHGR